MMEPNGIFSGKKMFDYKQAKRQKKGGFFSTTSAGGFCLVTSER